MAAMKIYFVFHRVSGFGSCYVKKFLQIFPKGNQLNC